MAWSHLHPALIHFVVGLGAALLVWDLYRLKESEGESEDGSLFGRLLEGWMGLVLLGIGTGWIALTHDTILQHGGKPFGLGEIHGKMGVLVLGLSTIRVLLGPGPRPAGFRPFIAGLDWLLLGLLLGTGLVGEWLVFHDGLGLKGITL